MQPKASYCGHQVPGLRRGHPGRGPQDHRPAGDDHHQYPHALRPQRFDTEFPETVNFVAHAPPRTWPAPTATTGWASRAAPSRTASCSRARTRSPPETFSAQHTLFQIDLYFGRGHPTATRSSCHGADGPWPASRKPPTRTSATEFGERSRSTASRTCVIPTSVVDYADFYNDLLRQTHEGRAPAAAPPSRQELQAGALLRGARQLTGADREGR